jgi:FtsP/CotA-like multicopper oxidase with cupredoxin domain
MWQTAALLVAFTGGLSAQNPAVTRGQPPPTPLAAPATDSLTTPPVLENRSDEPNTVEVTLTAAPTRLALVPGVETDVFAYNAQIPGPTLEVREGDRVIVHFRNLLPEETTVHWHGLHIPWTADGSPFHPIAPGEQADFVFTIQRGTAGIYWYHPHPHHHTRKQVAKGLYGAIIVRASDDPLQALPEKLLILSDNRFLADGSVDVQDEHSPRGRVDFENGREGDVRFVNGQIMPTIALRSGDVQRWRVINASAARVYRLRLPGHEFLHVGSDGGLFERPIATSEVLIANSERVELLVRATGPPRTRTVLQDLPYDRYIPQTRPGDWQKTRDLLTVQYSDELAIAARALPATLLPVERLDTADVRTTRVIVLTQGMINRKTMDMSRVDETTSLGATEIWQIENLVGMDHPFHLHGFRFQVLDRNGVPEPYASWKDTVNVPKHEMVRFIVRFDDYPGKWMFHCHILDHEEHGMMGILEVKGGDQSR